MRRVGNRVGKLSIVVVMLAAAGCGGGGGSKSSTTTTAGPAQTTTTVVSAATFAADLCKAGRSIADATPGAAGGYKLFADTYGKLVPTPEKKAPLAEFVAANRALQALWSGSTPTTPAAFSTKFVELTKNYNAAQTKLQVDCPPEAGATTTTTKPKAIRATGQLYSVEHATDGKGLWWYTAFACPAGKKLKLGTGLVPMKSDPSVGVILDKAAGAANPFTGDVANASYNRVSRKNIATCV